MSASRDDALNVLGGALMPCGNAPLTGFYRNGCCDTGPEDTGIHTVCAVMTDAFLVFSRLAGNDLSTPQPSLGFPGLAAGDRWCLCAGRWREALAAGVAPPVILAATHEETLAVIPFDDLERHAADGFESKGNDMKDMIGEPRVVPAGRGAAWWAEGFGLFRAAIGTWIGIMMIYLVITIGIGLIPFVGNVGHWLLTPVFMGGLMLGCAALRRGEPLRVSHLFEGFQGTHFVPLMIIGAVNIAIALAIVALAGVSIMASMHLSDMANMSDPMNAFLGSARAITGTSLLATLVILVIVAAFAMLNWFAPALVALRGVSAVEAMKLSFLACLRNWLPFLVYGLIGVGITLVAGIAFVAIAAALGAGAFLSDTTAGSLGAMLGFFLFAMAMMAVVALVVGPVLFGTTYAGYEDTLAVDEQALANPAYR